MNSRFRTRIAVEKPSYVTQIPDVPERRYQRFSLCSLVHLKVQLGANLTGFEAMSKNVSVGGLLLHVPSPVPKDSPVTFTMLMQQSPASRTIEIVGEGKVVRVEAEIASSGFEVAVEYSRPLMQIAAYFSGYVS